MRSWKKNPAGRFVFPDSTVSISGRYCEGQCLRQSDLRDWMQGEEWLAVRLIMEASPNTLTSSWGGGSDDDVALLDLDDEDFFFFFWAEAAVAAFFGSSSVERMVPTISFSMIKSANCDEWGAWTLCLCNSVFIPWKNRSFISQKTKSTWIISGSLMDCCFFFFFCFDFCLSLLLFLFVLPFEDTAAVFTFEDFFALFLVGPFSSSSSSSSVLISSSSSSSSLSLTSGFRIITPSKTRESSSDDDEFPESSLSLPSS
mmetsp:Transcript_22913/g.55243  ORF Transcript_22913/g.55243 Transcript_22913/m.55243 type:complete len:257 (+) Transcript_22913:608-1378(+)